MDETEGVSVTARYAYLLQPIRDLEANFNVNIQTVLERYCEGLPDEQRTNFVEAAMLLQGTATVSGGLFARETGGKADKMHIYFFEHQFQEWPISNK